ncbi:MAG: glycosyltransferase family 4 protein [Alphaproteobacteria bacterium]|nr:glycosyltransferase family 4 protein [Alphaproteobacteria bacterium]
MKVLLTHRYFWPDTAPYAIMLRAIGDALAETGHEVHTFSSIASYRVSADPGARREKLGALNVNRVWAFSGEKTNLLKQLANVLIYSVALFAEVLRVRPDVVTASTFPPIAAAWSASLAARLAGAKFVYHLQDIHPEVSQISGGRLGRGVAMRLLRWMDNQTLRRSDAIIVLSQDMAETLAARELGDLPLHVINNFSLDLAGDTRAAPPEALCKAPGKRRIIFAGNLGRFQNLDLLAEGVSQVLAHEPDLELLFLGDGVMVADLKRRWGRNPQIRFADFLPFEQARELIRDSDVGLVSLSPGIYRVAFPSKVMTYLGLGVPILALVEPQSQLARSLAASGLGAFPETGAPEAVAAALEGLLAQGIRSEAVSDWYEANAGFDRVTAQWKQILADFVRPSGRRATT